MSGELRPHISQGGTRHTFVPDGDGLCCVCEGADPGSPDHASERLEDLRGPIRDLPMVAGSMGDRIGIAVGPAAEAIMAKLDQVPLRLELGSGYAPTPGFVHLDANPNAPEVDIIGPAWPLDATFGDAVVHEIRAVDVLEHISYWDTDAALTEWARVLVPGGRLFVQVPDADRIVREYIKRQDAGRSWSVGSQPGVDPLRAMAWRLLGGHADGHFVHADDDWRLNAHYSLWSADSLRDALYQAGMSVESLETNGHPNLQCWAVKR